MRLLAWWKEKRRVILVEEVGGLWATESMVPKKDPGLVREFVVFGTNDLPLYAIGV